MPTYKAGKVVTRVITDTQLKTHEQMYPQPNVPAIEHTHSNTNLFICFREASAINEFVDACVRACFQHEPSVLRVKMVVTEFWKYNAAAHELSDQHEQHQSGVL